MRAWRLLVGVCLLAMGCGESLSEESLSDTDAPEPVSAQWANRHPELGPASLLKDLYPPPEDPVPGPFGGPAPTDLTSFRGRLFFSAFDFEAGKGALWRSEGTTASTVPVKHLADPPGRLTVVDKKLFFTGGFSEEHGAELWVSDGTTAGTRLLKNLRPDSGYTILENFIAVGDTLFFFRVVRPAIIAAGNVELWRSNGTSAGTVRVKDLGPEDAVNGPLDVASVGNRLFMSLGMPETGTELWVSDGTSAGTRLVKDILPGTGSSFPRHLTAAAGILYFSADDGEHGRELWRSDGTPRGTELVEDTRPGPEGSEAQPITVFKKRLYFATFTPGYTATDLRKLDPDPSCHPRSNRVATIPNPYANSPREFFIFVSSFTATDRKLYFTLFYDNGSPAPFDVQLWRTDGTTQGTKLLYQPLIVSPDLQVPTPVPTDDGRVVLYAYDTAHGHELWVSNGQPGGTRLLQDILPGPASSYPQDLLRAGNFIYFTARDAVHGREIWVLPVPPDRK